MADPNNSGGHPERAEWLKPPVEQHGLGRYVQTLRERIWVVVLAVVLCVGAAAAYVATTEKVYEAQLEFLVTPVPADDTTLVGLGLIRDSFDPTRDISTAAQLVTTPQIGRRATEKLGDPPTSVYDIDAQPVAQSNIVSLIARAGSARRATEIVNAWGEAVVEVRTEQLHSRLDEVVGGFRRRLDALPIEQRGSSAESYELAKLIGLQEIDDPTLRIRAPAEEPSDPVKPKPVLSIVAGVLIGLVLGVAGAFGLQALDPRLRREEQLREVFRLPVLARVPKEPRRRRGRPLTPESLSAAGHDAYRALRTTLQAKGEGRTRTVLITGSSPSEGKTSTAINLASAAAQAGKNVILIEGDLRRPSIAEALGIDTEREPTLGDAVINGVPLANVATTSSALGSRVGILLAPRDQYASAVLSDELSAERASWLVRTAGQLADLVVIDSPPLVDVIDPLPLAQAADQVVIVARVRRTSLTRLRRLGELLSTSAVTPAGVVILGTDRPSRKSGYYQYYRRPEDLLIAPEELARR
jgi:Mrp family chromosome partitioning ATPase/capsular polysaccharide biosynthesis protein